MAISEIISGEFHEPAKTTGRGRRVNMAVRRIVFLLALAGPPLLMAGLGLLDHASSNDEAFYLPLVSHYAPRPWLTPVLETNQAPISIGPAYFLAHRFWSAVWGDGAVQARALGLASMAIASLLWCALGRQLHYEGGWAYQLAFWLLPYHAAVAISALTEPFMLFFMLAAVYYWVLGINREVDDSNRQSKLYFLACGLLLGIAQNAKPPLITLPLALMVIGTVRVKNVWAVLGPFLAIAVQVPCWLAWGGLFPPGQRSGMMPQFAAWSGLFPDTSLHLLCVAGTVLWPAVNVRKKWRETGFMIGLGLAAWLVWGPRLGQANPDRFRFVGPMLQASYRADLVRQLYVLPFLAGWLIFWDSARMVWCNEVSIARQALLLAPVLSIVGFMRSPLGFDRYASCFMALWFLGLWPNLQKRPRALAISMIFMAVFALILIARVAFVRELLLV